MKLSELRYKLIIESLRKHKGDAEKVAKELKISSRTIYTFKKENIAALWN